MEVFVGVFTALLGLALIVFNGRLVEIQQRSNSAAFGQAFSGPGWRMWNRFVFLTVGAMFTTFGVLLALGVLGSL